MSKDVHIRSDELCERCRFGACERRCRHEKCRMEAGALCRCDEIQYGTPCPYFEEAES